MGVKWQNKDKFFRKLDSIVPHMAGELKAANLKSAQEMVATAGRLVSPGETGHLEESIRFSDGPTPTAFTVEAGGPLTTKNGYDYSLATEFGTQKETARPFFYPAYRVVRRTFRGRASRAIKKAVVAAGFG